LIAKTIDDFKSFNVVTETDKKGVELKWKHFDEKRRQKVRDLIAARATILEEEKTGLWSADGTTTKSKLVSKYA
jgi:hypothetical protein